ncbi:hypothetical protein RF55_13571 [Lasius niger]|uniref:Uncharacterized protein n=1 Tax=Lasius niger TaxID=67767 RepID=A0A0J7K9V6_LASNI|nr:hypothetical protein RF55_13571 [Lasius niger]
MARIHRAPNDITLLAATSRLVKVARKWFDLSSGSVIESWAGFREASLKRFTKKLLYHVAMEKVKAQKWNFGKESFLEYAMDKLALMHNHNLPADSTVYLLLVELAAGR